MNYQEAIAKLGDRDSRKVANHTYLWRSGPREVRLRLHKTDVLVFQPRRCILNSGGWRTMTTKARINEFSPARIQSVRGQWTVGRVVVWDETRFLALTSKPGAPFRDGMAVNYKGQPIKSFKPLGDLTGGSFAPAQRPYVLSAATLQGWKDGWAAGKYPRIPFKQLATGEHWQRHGYDLALPTVKGWELVKEHFVDSSGFGQRGEPALTVEEFLNALVPGHGYFLSGVGQFQVKVAEFKRAA